MDNESEYTRSPYYFALDVLAPSHLPLCGPSAPTLFLLFILPGNIVISMEVFFILPACPQPLLVQKVQFSGLV